METVGQHFYDYNACNININNEGNSKVVTQTHSYKTSGYNFRIHIDNCKDHCLSADLSCQNENLFGIDMDEYTKIREKLEEYKCPICMEVLVKTSMISCGHRFCTYCIKQWFHHSYPRRFCPVCRKNCVYYQDDNDADVNISNLFDCLPLSDQEERNNVVLDREYSSDIPINSINYFSHHHQNTYFDDFGNEFHQTWTSQYTTDVAADSPFEPEQMNHPMAENYYPSYQQYMYEPTYTELEYQERFLSGPVHQQDVAVASSAVPQTNPDGSLSYHQGHPYLTSNSIIPNGYDITTSSTNDMACNRDYTQGPSQALRLGGSFAGNEVYQQENLEMDPHNCATVYGMSGDMTNDAIRNSHYANHMTQQVPPVSLDYTTDPQNLMWEQNFPDRNQNLYNHGQPNLHGVFDPAQSHANAESYKHQYATYGGSGRSISHVPREMYRAPEAPNNVAWNAETEATDRVQLSSDWQLMNRQPMEENWGLPPLGTTSADFDFCNRSKYAKKFVNPPNTTHEDYQQDVLIQEEFQRLDEMLLRDDDLCISETDQVSVESVVSSEQQYDSPWEQMTSNQTRSRDVKGGPVQTTGQTLFNVANSNSDQCNPGPNVSSLKTRVQTVEEFQHNYEQHADLYNKVQDKKLPLQCFSGAVKNLQVTSSTNEPVKFRSKPMPKSALDVQRWFQPDTQQQRIPEQKRVQERFREDMRLNDRPGPGVAQNKPMDLGPSTLEFRQGTTLTTRRTTPRLPKIRIDQQHKKFSPMQVVSLKRKPPTRAPTPGLPDGIAPNNMMGVSHGDGVWGTVPEMKAHMYLPYGMLLFKMEYQPNGNGTHFSNPISKYQQPPNPPQPQPQQQPNTSSLVKFTHPVIHMLPLSPDGSTRLNITFDVVYQT